MEQAKRKQLEKFVDENTPPEGQGLVQLHKIVNRIAEIKGLVGGIKFPATPPVNFNPLIEKLSTLEEGLIKGLSIEGFSESVENIDTNLEALLKAIRQGNDKEPDNSAISEGFEDVTDKLEEVIKTIKEYNKILVGSGRGNVTITDDNGNKATVTNGKLDVNATVTVTVADSAKGESNHGAVIGLAISASADMVSYIAVAGDNLRGFSAISNRAARFRLKINGTTKLAGRSDLGSETCVNYIPVAIELIVGDVLVLEVTNEGQGTSASEGSIIIEQ